MRKRVNFGTAASRLGLRNSVRGRWLRMYIQGKMSDADVDRGCGWVSPPSPLARANVDDSLVRIRRFSAVSSAAEWTWYLVRMVLPPDVTVWSWITSIQRMKLAFPHTHWSDVCYRLDGSPSPLSCLFLADAGCWIYFDILSCFFIIVVTWYISRISSGRMMRSEEHKKQP